MLTRNCTKLILRTLQNVQRRSMVDISELSDFEIQHKYCRVVKTPSLPMTFYGGRHTVTMIPGGGLGPELSTYVKLVFKYAGAPVDFEEVTVDANRTDNKEMDYAITVVQRNGVAIKGIIETKNPGPDVQLGNVALRNRLDLYVYLVWCKSYPGIPARYTDLDVIVIKENTEGEYIMLEHSPRKGVVQSLKVITEFTATKVARFAFEFARKNKRKKVTTVHKANIMKYSDGLFLDVCRRMAKEYPDLDHNDMIIDNCCMQLVSNPHQFDVIVTLNLYGNIVGNVLFGLTSGAGLISGRNCGDHFTVFEPAARALGMPLVGTNTANPVAMLNASVDMLYHLGHHEHANKIGAAVKKTVCEDGVRTADLGGKATTLQVIERVICNVMETCDKRK